MISLSFLLSPDPNITVVVVVILVVIIFSIPQGSVISQPIIMKLHTLMTTVELPWQVFDLGPN